MTTPSPSGSRRPRGPLTDAHIEKLEEIKRESAILFYEKGYAATDVRQIADALHMHVSSLYNYISGKEELLYLLMKDGLVDISAGLDAALEVSDDPAEQLRAAVQAHVLHHAHRRHRAWTGHVEVRALTGEYLDEIKHMRRDYENRWIGLLKRGMEEGKFKRSDPQITAYSLMAIGQALSRWYEPQRRMSAEEIAAQVAEIAMTGVLA
ncbi:MAG TPA: TetR/AcrR family transcriptional regulator [Trebonia sp.]|jgi:AcrR family transcriptional regulator|nr:TetR/AcrR family transcriptional regulator [Trebonia sp.]